MNSTPLKETNEKLNKYLKENELEAKSIVGSVLFQEVLDFTNLSVEEIEKKIAKNEQNPDPLVSKVIKTAEALSFVLDDLPEDSETL